MIKIPLTWSFRRTWTCAFSLQSFASSPCASLVPWSNDCINKDRRSWKSESKWWWTHRLPEPAQPPRCQYCEAQTWPDNDQREAEPRPASCSGAPLRLFWLKVAPGPQSSRGFCLSVLLLPVYRCIAATPDGEALADKSLQPVAGNKALKVLWQKERKMHANGTMSPMDYGSAYHTRSVICRCFHSTV